MMHMYLHTCTHRNSDNPVFWLLHRNVFLFDSVNYCCEILRNFYVKLVHVCLECLVECLTEIFFGGWGFSGNLSMYLLDDRGESVKIDVILHMQTGLPHRIVILFRKFPTKSNAISSVLMRHHKIICLWVTLFKWNVYTFLASWEMLFVKTRKSMKINTNIY